MNNSVSYKIIYRNGNIHTSKQRIVILRFKKIVRGLLCNLQKAFDCVNHNILVAKMKIYGISGIANKLKRAYLENRYHRISMKDIKLYLPNGNM